LTVQGEAELRRGLEQAATASRTALDVARVGVWFFSTDGEELLCACTAQRDGTVAAQDPLRLADLPRYASALQSRRVILAHDARRDPDTSELTVPYLLPNDIHSMLDAPIYRFGEVVGVVCHEHTGSVRDWTGRERDFAASVADVIAVLLEQATRTETERALHAQKERTAKAERTASLVRFGAGIAHDFNNVLAAALVQLQVMQRKYTEPDIETDLRELLASLDAGRQIVKQLLAYCKPDRLEARALVLNRLLEDHRALLTAAAGERHRLTLELPPERVTIQADPTRIDQLLLNLVVNAKEAMTDGAGKILVQLKVDGDWAVLSVSDTGVGIADDVRERIFEPFFTTKGAGTGLGLSTVKSIVDQHGGHLDVTSEPGNGTTFTARFPRIGG
jgi:signal transduction histidine kinase